MVSPRRTTGIALALVLGVPLAGLTGTSVQAAPAHSGPYVRDTTTLSGGTGSVRDVATLKDDSIFVASSLSNGTGVLDILDNPGDNVPPDDDSLSFSSAVLGVAANQVDDTAYFVTNSSSIPSGQVWTTAPAAAYNPWSSVTWGGPTGQEKFVAVASSGSGDQVMTTISDTWVSWQLPLTNAWSSVTWGGPTGQEKFVAVASSGTGDRVMTSPNGITWTSRTSAADNNWTSVTWGGPTGQEKFVAVASSGTGDRVMTSPDGITWTSRTSAADNNWTSVTWGGPTGQEKFVAVASSGTGNRVMTSPDGITWTARTSAADNPWSAVTWGGTTGQETFVAVSSAVFGNVVMTSSDGVTWTARASAANDAWSSVTFGGSAGQQKFVAVSSVPGNLVMSSATVAAPAGGRAALWTYARGAVDDSAPLPGTGVGGAWADIAVNNTDDTVYVTSQEDTRIIAFRGNNLDDSRSIALPAGTTPYALAVNQADDTVYLLSYASGTTSYLTAMRGANPDDSTTVTLLMVPGRQTLAINPIDGTVYVGGWNTVGKIEAYAPGLTFADVASIGMGPSVSGLAVSGDGRRVYATADNGSAYLFNTANFTDTATVALGVTSPGAVAVDDYGWAWTGGPSTSTGSRSVVQIGTAPAFTAITPASGLTAGGYTATITGSWFTPATIAALDVEANLAPVVGTPTSNTMTVTVPPGIAGTVDLILINVAGFSQPLGVNDSGSFTYVNPPPPTFPPSPPLGVTAVAGDGSAAVAWTPPASPGSFPVSNYSVTASPGGKTCLTPTLTCEVTGLSNGTAYTFTVKALNGAGWSAESAPSNAVTPKADTRPSIVITGSREGSMIRIDGSTTGLSGTVTPWIKFRGESAYTEGSARPTIVNDAFTWSRKANKKTYAYFTHESIKSNTVIIAAR